MLAQVVLGKSKSLVSMKLSKVKKDFPDRDGGVLCQFDKFRVAAALVVIMFVIFVEAAYYINGALAYPQELQSFWVK